MKAEAEATCSLVRWHYCNALVNGVGTGKSRRRVRHQVPGNRCHVLGNISTPLVVRAPEFGTSYPIFEKNRKLTGVGTWRIL